MSDTEDKIKILRKTKKTKNIKFSPVIFSTNNNTDQPEIIKPPVGSELEFADSIKDMAYEALIIPMSATKRPAFKTDLKKNKTIDNYLDQQLNTTLIKSCNSHMKFGVVYCYLFYKNFMTL